MLMLILSIGFSFIGEMDEMVISMLDVDMKRLQEDRKYIGNSNKIFIMRMTIYIMTPIIAGIYGYITLTNWCFFFCKDLGNWTAPSL